MEFLHAKFLASSLIVEHNAIKNIIFRVSTLILDFAILRLFALLAFRRSDYTSFLMFAEDIIQKAFFVFSRGITSRQSLLVGSFALVTVAGEFYDTMLWAIDNPGYVTRHNIVSGDHLATQMVNIPSYVIFVAANKTKPSEINNLNTTFMTDLYAFGLNFSLPGIFQDGSIEMVPPPPIPLNPLVGTNRLWLDDEGFAIGLDFTITETTNMSFSPASQCFLHSATTSTAQSWDCEVSNGEAEDKLQKIQGAVAIWWDADHYDWLLPNNDNPWVSVGTSEGTAMMKQVFTITKGRRRHTFISTVIKASMSTYEPNMLADREISDFMRRTWSNGTITPTVQYATDTVLYAKGNHTGRTFGSFLQSNASLLSIATDYLNITYPIAGQDHSVLRCTITNITLIRSETIADEPTPVALCPGAVYRNIALGGSSIDIFPNCNSPQTLNQSWPSSNGHFWGQVDTSAVAIFTGSLGDGMSNLSSVALTDVGIEWISQQGDHMDNLIISRAMLVGGNASAVMVDVGTNVPAISGLQLLLCILPLALAVLTWWFTRAGDICYYCNSFLAAVLATTHTAAMQCEQLGYIHSMPEISLQKRGRHVMLGTPHDGTLIDTASTPTDEPHMAYEPLIPEKDRI